MTRQVVLNPSVVTTPAGSTALIFASNCGAGNVTSANAVKEALMNMPHYFTDVKILKDIDEAWPGGNKMAGVHVTLAQKGWQRTCNLIAILGEKFMRIYQGTLRRYFEKRIIEERPSLLVSTTPLINSALANLSKKYHIPLLMVSADLDARLYTLYWKEQDNQANCALCVPYSCYESSRTIADALDKQHVYFTGYPIVPESSREYSPLEKMGFQQDLGIPSNKKVVLITMGSLGSDETFNYFDSFIREKQRFSSDTHFVFLCGRNQALKERMQQKLVEELGYTAEDKERFSKEDEISFSLFGFRNDMYKCMAVSDCMVAKSGSATVNEAIAMSLPTLLSKTTIPLEWEQLAFRLFYNYTLGSEINPKDDAVGKILEMLEHRDDYVTNIQLFKQHRSSQFDFKRRITDVIEKLMDAQATHQMYEPKHVILPFEIIKNLLYALLFPLIKLLQFLINWCYFTGYISIHPNKHATRRFDLIKNKHAKAIEGVFSPITHKQIDAIHIPATHQSTPRKILIMQCAKNYTRLNPRNYEKYLENGYDVVLYDPTKIQMDATTADLQALILKVKHDDPDASISLYGFSIGGFIVMNAAKDMPKYIDAIICDRGFSKPYQVANNIFVLFKVFKSYIQSHGNIPNATLRKLPRTLFLSPRQNEDFLTHSRLFNRNLIRKMFTLRQNPQDTYIELDPGMGHWSRLGPGHQQAIVDFLG